MSAARWIEEKIEKDRSADRITRKNRKRRTCVPNNQKKSKIVRWRPICAEKIQNNEKGTRNNEEESQKARQPRRTTAKTPYNGKKPKKAISRSVQQKSTAKRTMTAP